MDWETTYTDKIEKQQLDLSEDSLSPKTIYLVWGNKGEGKTNVAFSFPGSICCLSFDRKSVLTKVNNYNDRKDIHIWDCLRYYVDDKEHYTESSALTYEYVNQIIEQKIKSLNPDWCVIDGAEIMIKIAEGLMRHNNSIKAFAGVSNLNLWKERNSYMNAIHNKLVSLTKRGLIYTTYSDKQDFMQDGIPYESKERPKWVGDMMMQTDVVLHASSKYSKEHGKQFFVHVNSSKNDRIIKTGSTHDVTDKKLNLT